MEILSFNAATADAPILAGELALRCTFVTVECDIPPVEDDAGNLYGEGCRLIGVGDTVFMFRGFNDFIEPFNLGRFSEDCVPSVLLCG